MADNRPLSPHLGIYKWRITMLTSTLHRVSGMLVSLGMFILVIQLLFLANADSETYHSPGMLLTAFWFVWTLAVYYHLCNGIRHLVWDVGKGFELETAEKTAKWAFAGALALTILTWVFA